MSESRVAYRSLAWTHANAGSSAHPIRFAWLAIFEFCVHLLHRDNYSYYPFGDASALHVLQLFDCPRALVMRRCHGIEKHNTSTSFSPAIISLSHILSARRTKTHVYHLQLLDLSTIKISMDQNNNSIFQFTGIFCDCHSIFRSRTNYIFVSILLQIPSCEDPRNTEPGQISIEGKSIRKTFVQPTTFCAMHKSRAQS